MRFSIPIVYRWSGGATGGGFTTAVASAGLILPYLAFAACCGAIVVYATRIPQGTT
jgi:hypothetical protein